MEEWTLVAGNAGRCPIGGTWSLGDRRQQLAHSLQARPGRPGEGCESNGIAHRYSAASWSLYFLMMLFRFSFRAAVVMSFSGVQASEETCTLVGISKRARLFALPMARKDSRTASRVGFSFFISHVTMATQLP
eukprot:GGOE01027361.1.p2 GENE.GGOE01027361.1~~GGOE01027361.1.p2  ORF type:complete len:133 (-),score=15.18 GGOE01027361.1:36-434(-)